MGDWVGLVMKVATEALQRVWGLEILRSTFPEKAARSKHFLVWGTRFCPWCSFRCFLYKVRLLNLQNQVRKWREKIEGDKREKNPEKKQIMIFNLQTPLETKVMIVFTLKTTKDKSKRSNKVVNIIYNQSEAHQSSSPDMNKPTPSSWKWSDKIGNIEYN